MLMRPSAVLRYGALGVLILSMSANFALAQARGGQRGQGQAGGGGQRGAANAVPPAPAAPAEPAPRWADGRVNLGSTSDQKGYWEVRPGLGGLPRAADVPFQPWARAVYEYRTASNGKDSPLVACKAAGGPSFFNAPGFELVDVPDMKSIFILNIAGPHTWRVIHMTAVRILLRQTCGRRFLAIRSESGKATRSLSIALASMKRVGSPDRFPPPRNCI